MITNFIFFGLNVPNWIFWVIGAIFMFSVAVFLFLGIKEQKETEEAIIKEMEKEKEAEDKKRKENGYYSLNNSDTDTTFFSVLNCKISVLWEVNRKSTNDMLTLSSSLPIAMNENDLQNFHIILPGVINIKVINKWQLSLKKSPAADFYSNKKIILKYLFHYLNKKYAWLGQGVVVNLSLISNEVICTIPYKTSNHYALAFSLSTIDGINGENLIAQMSYKGNIFPITKEDTKTWDELIPLIKSVFVDYFPKDVEFTGDYPSFEKNIKTEKNEEDVNLEEE